MSVEMRSEVLLLCREVGMPDELVVLADDDVCAAGAIVGERGSPVSAPSMPDWSTITSGIFSRRSFIDN